MMESFWDISWKKGDAERIRQYIDGFRADQDWMTEYLRGIPVRTICDAGCGCGLYSYQLALMGFEVKAFDVSSHAVEIARKSLGNRMEQVELKAASVLDTGYQSHQFDCVVSRDVLDHMTKKAAVLAVRELIRIVKPGGSVLISLDHADEEYEREKHSVNEDGDYQFEGGKWDGMVFHPYSRAEFMQMIPENAEGIIQEDGEGLRVVLTKKQ